MRQRLCLFHHTKVPPTAAMELPDCEITFQQLVDADVTAEHVITARVGILELKRRGASSAEDLKRLKFDALHLVDDSIASEMQSAYGSQEVRRAFVNSATDAVYLAGTAAQAILGSTATDLLDLCVGMPVEAASVLEQLEHAQLRGVDCNIVLNTGVRGESLKRVGIEREQAVDLFGATAVQLKKLYL